MDNSFHILDGVIDVTEIAYMTKFMDAETYNHYLDLALPENCLGGIRLHLKGANSGLMFPCDEETAECLWHRFNRHLDPGYRSEKEDEVLAGRIIKLGRIKDSASAKQLQLLRDLNFVSPNVLTTTFRDYANGFLQDVLRARGSTEKLL